MDRDWSNRALDLLGRRAVELLPDLPEIGARAEVDAPDGRDGDRRLAVRTPLDADGDGARPSLLLLCSPPPDDRARIEREIVAEISHALASTRELDEFLRRVHDSLRRIVYAENLFVALHDPEADLWTFPYFVDQHDENPGSLPVGRSCTDYILRTGRPALIGRELLEELVQSGAVELVGSWSPSWMGVPLRSPDRTLGVLAMQHYEDEGAFSERDLELCSTLASPITLAIERRLQEESLRRSQALLTSIVDSMHDGLLVLDEDFHVLYINRAMERLSGMPRENIVGRELTVFEVFPYLVEQGLDDNLRRAQRGEPQELPEVRFELPDGRKGVSHDIYLPLRRPSGDRMGVLALVRDITDAVAARADLRQKEVELQHVQKMEAIGRLAGGVAHDFNNLLTAINGFSEMLLDEVEDESPLREPLGEIRAAGLRAAALTQKLLALSRKQVAHATRVDLNRLLREFEPMLCRMIGNRVDVAAELAAEPCPTLVDPLQLEQILLNLAVNAADAMPDGGQLTVRVVDARLESDSARHPVEPGRYVGLEVEDDGVGMTETVRERIFEPFFTTKERGKGTGLGLAIVYGIVKQNGGSIWVESEPDVGSKVRVYFPRADGSAAVAGASAAGVGTSAETSTTGSGTILLVEDEAPVRSLVKTILSRAGYRVIDMADASAAIEAFAAWDGRIDLVVSDVVMPHVRGPELVARLRSRRPDLPVLFISGHLGDGVDRQQLIGDDPLLVKPFGAGDLLRRIAEILES